MTSSAAQGFDAGQDELLALISGDPELRTALTAIAESIESGEASATERRLSDWLNWLDEEGYSATTVQDHSKRFGSLLQDAGISHRISGDTKTSDFVQELGQVPHLLELMFTLVDHSLTLHSELVGAAGGTGIARGKSVAQRLGVDRKKLAIREGAGEAREASSEFDSTARDGQSQGGLNDRGLEPRRDEFGGRAQDVADRISTAREGRYVTREDGLNDRGLEPRRDYMPTGGERDANAEMRETKPGMEGATDPSRGEPQREADRISTAREGRYVTREDGLNDSGLEPRRDYEPQEVGRAVEDYVADREMPGRDGAGREPEYLMRQSQEKEIRTARDDREMVGGRGGRDPLYIEKQNDEESLSTARERRNDNRNLDDAGLEPRRDYEPQEVGRAVEDYVADREMPGRDGAGREPEYLMRQSQEKEIRTARERRENFDDAGLEPRRDYEPQEVGRAVEDYVADREMPGRDGAGREPEYLMRQSQEKEIRTARERRNDKEFDDAGLEPRRDYETQGEADRISTAREGRYMRQERRSEEERISADVRDALRDRRDDNLILNSNGGGVESPAAKAFDDVRDVVREEREPIIGGKGGVEPRSVERKDRREDMVAENVAKLEMPGRNGGGVESPAAKAFDDVRDVVREEREPIIGGKGGVEPRSVERKDRREDMVAENVAKLEMPGRNGGGVESPEARRYDEVREERIERREDMVADDVAKLEMPGRNGGGVESREARRYDEVREERKDERDDITMEAAEFIRTGMGAVEYRDAIREKREVEMADTLERTENDARAVIRTREDMNTILYDGTNGAGSEPRSDMRPSGGEKDAKAEMRETGPDMLGATE